MKATIISLLALGIVQACSGITLEEIGRQVIRRTGCLERENLTLDAVEAFTIQGKFFDAEVTPGIKCFGACVLERNGFMQGCRVLDERFAHIEALADVHKTIVKCKAEVNAGERCECSYQLLKCFAEHGAAQIDFN